MKLNPDGTIVKRQRAKSSRHRVPEITYKVKWNTRKRTFDIYRQEVATGGFARDRVTAIDLARRDAEAERQGISVAVMGEHNGAPTVEWSRWW